MYFGEEVGRLGGVGAMGGWDYRQDAICAAGEEIIRLSKYQTCSWSE